MAFWKHFNLFRNKKEILRAYALRMTYFAFVLLLLWPTDLRAFLLPAHTLLENNVFPRKYLKGLSISHKIEFLEGFYSSASFRCEETISFKNNEMVRFDYLCDGVPLTLLYKGKERKIIYNKKTTPLEITPLGWLPALFLTTQIEPLIQSLARAEFIEAEIVQENPEEENPKPEKEQKKDKEEPFWSVSASVLLVKLGKIERSTPEKLEKNITLLLSPFSDSSKKIFFEKDIFLPQKIDYRGRGILFKNYRELTFSSRLALKYPQKIEIQEDDTTGIVLESLFEKIRLQPNFPKDFFKASKIASEQSKAFDDPAHKEVVEKFIQEYR